MSAFIDDQMTPLRGYSFRPRALRAAVRMAFAATLLAVCCVSSHADRTFKLGYPGIEKGIWAQLADSLAKSVAKAGIKIDYYPLLALGGDRLAIELVQKGAIDLAAVNGVFLAREVKQFNLLNLPFLATNITEARAIIKKVGPQLGKFAEAKGLRILAYTWVVGTFVSQGDCVLMPADIKGSRVLDGPPLLQDLVRRAGATSTPVSANEAFAAIEAGLSGTGIFSVEFVQVARLDKVTKCLTDPSRIALMVLPIVLVAKQASWNALSDSERKSLSDAVAQLETDSDKVMQEQISKTVALYKVDGKSVKPMDQKALNAWRELARSQQEALAKENEFSDLLKEAIAAVRSRS
jgi:TRAP-type C4-dicarboxylate transport system substrate-binding protein